MYNEKLKAIPLTDAVLLTLIEIPKDLLPPLQQSGVLDGRYSLYDALVNMCGYINRRLRTVIEKDATVIIHNNQEWTIGSMDARTGIRYIMQRDTNAYFTQKVFSNGGMERKTFDLDGYVTESKRLDAAGNVLRHTQMFGNGDIVVHDLRNDANRLRIVRRAKVVIDGNEWLEDTTTVTNTQTKVTTETKVQCHRVTNHSYGVCIHYTGDVNGFVKKDPQGRIIQRKMNVGANYLCRYALLRGRNMITARILEDRTDPARTTAQTFSYRFNGKDVTAISVNTGNTRHVKNKTLRIFALLK